LIKKKFPAKKIISGMGGCYSHEVNEVNKKHEIIKPINPHHTQVNCEGIRVTIQKKVVCIPRTVFIITNNQFCFTQEQFLIDDKVFIPNKEYDIWQLDPNLHFTYKVERQNQCLLQTFLPTFPQELIRYIIEFDPNIWCDTNYIAFCDTYNTVNLNISFQSKTLRQWIQSQLISELKEFFQCFEMHPKTGILEEIKLTKVNFNVSSIKIEVDYEYGFTNNILGWTTSPSHTMKNNDLWAMKYEIIFQGLHGISYGLSNFQKGSNYNFKNGYIESKLDASNIDSVFFGDVGHPVQIGAILKKKTYEQKWHRKSHLKDDELTLYST
jgi:hypothetical protein